MATMFREVDSVFNNFDDLCRLCAAKTNLIHGINMFENTGLVRQIIKKVELCLPIQIQETDQLPKMICENCIYKLDMLYDFRDRSLRTETLLTDLLNEIALTHMGITTHLSTRDNINVGHDLVLRSADMGHSLDNIDINSQSNHSIQNEALVNASLVATHFGENLTLNIQHELNDPYALSDINLDENTMQTVEDSSNSCDNRLSINIKDKMSADFQLLLEAHPQLRNLSKSPSSSTLLDKTATSLTDLYLLQSNVQATASSTRLLKLNCNICNAEFDNGESVQLHYETHFKKCSFCLALFGDDKLLHEHILLVHAKDLQEPKSFYLQLSDDIRLIHTDSNGISHRTPPAPSSPPPLVLISQPSALPPSLTTCHILLNTLAVDPPKTSSITNNEKGTNIGMSKLEDNDSKYGILKAELDIKVEHNTSMNDDDFDLDYDDLSVDSNEMDNNDTDNNTNDAHDFDGEDGGNDDDDNEKKLKVAAKVCEECGKIYRTNYKLREHMRKHTGEQPFKCGSCDKAFRSKIGLAQHEAKHTGQYEFSCTTCGKGFQCRSYLVVHQRVHSDAKPYTCSTCSARFKSKQSLLDHTNRHLGVKPYTCDVCGRGFITKGLCKAHQAVHTGIDNKRFTCKICSKMFVSKSYLQTHMKIHTGEKPFMCEVCGKGFLTRVDLKIHSTMHTGEKSFVCEICGKAFARRDALRCHRRSHTGERPYSCDLCGQSFTQFSPMAIHKRLHTGERPYECEVCKRKFISRSTMMVHAKKHKDKR